MMNGKGKPRPGGPKEPLGWQTDALANVGGGMAPNDPYSPTSRKIAPFMPGQQGLLADQLNAGFGGGVEQWSGMLDQWTSPMRMPKPFNYGMGGDKGKGKDSGIPDLTRQEMKVAQPWVPMNGAFRNPQQEIDFRALDPRIQQWLRAQWGGSQ